MTYGYRNATRMYKDVSEVGYTWMCHVGTSRDPDKHNCEI